MSKVRHAIEEYRQFGLAHVFRHALDSLLDGLFRAIGKHFFTRIPLKDVIIIESHNDFDCNGGAFYRYLLQRGLNERYRIIWLIRNPKPKTLPKNVRCFDFFRPSLIKEYYCCVAKHILNDDKFIGKRRPGQVCVYCTHGAIGLKNVRGLIVIPDDIDFILSPSAWYDPYMCRDYSVDYPNDRMLHIGFPSNDLLFNGTEDECARIREQHYSKYILWMPTFRSNSKTRNDSDATYPFGIPLVNTLEELERINSFCRDNDSLLIIKIHPMQVKESYQALKDMSNVAVLDGEKTKRLGVDNYRLMRCCDAMISDYSSAPYSFLLLNRPIAFDFSDLQHYKIGLAVDNLEDFTPGAVIYSVEELMRFLQNVCSGNDEYRDERTRVLNNLYEYQDGDSSYRLALHLGLLQEQDGGERKQAD